MPDPALSTLKFEPDYEVPPGASLKERLADLGLTQAELAVRAGLSTKHVNQIVQGAAPITQETALAFETVTGVPARVWNRLEANYRERLARAERRTTLAQDVGWLDELPLRDLKKRGYLPDTRDKQRLMEAACEFFGVTDRRAWERAWLEPVASFRRSPTLVSDRAALAAWLRIGEIKASRIESAPFDAAIFRKVLQRARRLTVLPMEEALPQLVDECAKSGVAVVLVAEIPGARASGAAKWLSPTRAMIILSFRYKSDDQFWFSFFHEAAHILLHSKKHTFIEDSDGGDDAHEREANEFAEALLIPRDQERRLEKLDSPAAIERFAGEIGIAPGIVVGRLQREGLLPWRTQANHLKRSIDPLALERALAA